MHAIVADRFRFQKEACSETQAHHLSRDRIGCGRAVDGSAADRADITDNGPGRGTTADGAKRVSVRADQSGRRADRIQRNNGNTGELDEPARPERARTPGETRHEDADGTRSYHKHPVPAGGRPRRDDSAGNTGLTAADGTDACSPGDSAGSAADASRRADTTRAAFTAADSAAGSTKGARAWHAQRRSKVRHTRRRALHTRRPRFRASDRRAIAASRSLSR